MSDTSRTYGLLAIKIFVGLAFLAGGASKLLGAEMMVQTFTAIGWGQWFRYVAGIIEVCSAVLLFIPGWQTRGAALLVCTMIGAVIVHLAVLGPSAIPAAALGVMSAIILYAHKDQLQRA